MNEHSIMTVGVMIEILEEAPDQFIEFLKQLDPDLELALGHKNLDKESEFLYKIDDVVH